MKEMKLRNHNNKEKLNHGKRNIKLVTIILIIGILIVLCNESLAFFNFVSFNKVSKSTETVFKENLAKIDNINSMLISINKIKTNTVDNMSLFSAGIIKKERTLLAKSLDLLIKCKSNSAEEDNFIITMPSKFNSYFSNLDNMVKNVESDKEIDNLNLLNAKSIADSITTNLENYNTIVQKEINSSSALLVSQARYSKYINIIMSQVVVAIIIVVFAFFIKEINKALKDFQAILEEVKRGNLAVDVDCNGKNEFAIMRRELKSSLDAIILLINKFKKGTDTIDDRVMSLSAVSEEMAASAEQVNNSILQVSKGSESQTNDLVEIVNLIKDFTVTLKEVVGRINVVHNNASDASKVANVGGSELNKLIASLETVQSDFKSMTERVTELDTSVNKINEITELINGITDQTNLLALNAAIEAARAGDAGKGFAVVANEIRRLAEQSKNALEEINSIVKGIKVETKEVIIDSNNLGQSFKHQEKTIRDSIKSFSEIVQSVSNIVPLVENVKSFINELERKNNSIANKTENATAVAQENLATSEEITASTSEMSKSAEDVADTANTLTKIVSDTLDNINNFKID
ncbi:methyl-accepting chemotaxis protein [Inconstantimicrobium porci]|uniref:Methyl-accepting chemotaxis protein n=1 Tax=Inconstantimicrobium porci TaxID=2652291 RepID=A0A7X2MX17_9CLOT|nr:methyl-accepting chemotaxis protein [Inconstantimicrobium porci]MSR90642.1 methyl-accepting chemotaxis protein [Inconstantimicrobium porci]